jgi:hypothetical protein
MKRWIGVVVEVEGVVSQVEGVVVEVDRVWIMRWRGWRWWMARYPYKRHNHRRRKMGCKQTH